MEKDFDLDIFLENLAEEQLFKNLSPTHREQELAREKNLQEFSSLYAKETRQQTHTGERPNPIVPELIEEPESRAMKKPVDENGYPFVSQSDAVRILGLDRQTVMFSDNGVIRVEREKIPSSAKSPRIWIRLIDLKSYLENRDPIKAAKLGRCLTQIDEFRALAAKNGFKIRFLGSDYDRPEFYQNLI